MTKTLIADWLHKDRVGYTVAFYLSEKNQKVVGELLQELNKELPGVLWTMPTNRLHVTLFEIIMTLRDYPEDKDEMYNKHKEEIESSLDALFRGQKPIQLHFDTLDASEQTIIIKATDDGSFQKLRDKAVQMPIIQPGSVAPPDIIHSSIARYTSSVDLEKVQAVVSKHSILLDEEVTEFFLDRIYRTPIESDCIKSYPL